MSHYTKKDIMRLVEEEDVEFIRLQFTDLFGNLKNAAVTASQLEKVLDNRYVFDGSCVEGFLHDNDMDMFLCPDLDTLAIFPWRPQQGKVARLICDIQKRDGSPYEGDSRYILQKVLKEAEGLGYRFDVGPECEFFLFHTDDDGNPTVFSHEKAGYFDMSPIDQGENVRRDIILTLEEMGFEVESSYHEVAFAQHEIDFRYDEARGIYEITADRLQGNYMLLDEASVTGTANILMAAVLAKGTTTIYNAACEPYLQQLCRMLNRMGAKISGIASNLLTIEGVEELHGTQHTVLPDMIEVGSFIGMAAMTKSEITIKNVSYENLGIIPESFRRLGIKLEQRGDDIYVPAQETYEIESFIDGSIMTIADAPWPGLTPDLLSVMLVVATQAKGSVLIHQKMFESRLFFVDKLIDMGAQIILCDPHRAVVIGHNHGFKLRGARLTSPDIRAGIALLIAAMSAEGTSTISNIEQIDRGYQNIEGRLNAIGARITRI